MSTSRRSAGRCGRGASRAPATRAQLAADIAAAIRTRRGDDLGDDRPPSVLAWGRKYLPDHFRRSPSRMHLWLDARLVELSQTRGGRLNALGPRGAAKSTIGSLCYVLQSALEQREPYIWIVSDTKSQAQTHLANVRHELESNRRLAGDYPRQIGPAARWRTGSLELAGGCAIECYGTGQQVRGRRLGAHRPTLIVCDDLQNDAHIASADRREATRTWFFGTLLKAGTKRTNVVNLATALHRDALAMQLHTTPGWTSALFRAIETWPTHRDLWETWERIYCDENDGNAAAAARQYYEAHRDAMDAGAQVLWPEEEDLYTLMKMRVEEGRSAFEREKQCAPIDPSRCEWPEDYFGDDFWFADWPAELALRTMALDPSKGADARHGDYSAFVLLGVDRRGLLYVEADLARRPTPQIIADGAALCRRFAPDVLGVETNQFQELLADELAAALRRQSSRPVELAAIDNHVNKAMRIRRLGPYLSQRRFRFHDGSPSTRRLVDQLRDFPLGTHDDGPDALEMALRLAEQRFAAGDRDDGLGSRLPVGD